MRLKFRLLTVGAIFWSFVILVHMFVPLLFDRGVHPKLNAYRKMLWSDSFDVVIGGDSRSLAGIAPQAIQEVLPGIHVANFSFTSVCYTPEYLHAIESLLNLDGTVKALVFGITPHSFTDQAFEKSEFLQLATKHHKLEMMFALLASPVFHVLNDSFFAHLWKMLSKERAGFYIVHHPDGWIATRESPESPTRQLSYYKLGFLAFNINETREEIFLHQIRNWTKKGIKVYGVRLPILKELLMVEQRHSGFSGKNFSARFVENGGTWLDFDMEEYHCSDASHLRYDSAILISREIARRIKDDL